MVQKINNFAILEGSCEKSGAAAGNRSATEEEHVGAMAHGSRECSS